MEKIFSFNVDLLQNTWEILWLMKQAKYCKDWYIFEFFIRWLAWTGTLLPEVKATPPVSGLAEDFHSFYLVWRLSP